MGRDESEGPHVLRRGVEVSLLLTRLLGASLVGVPHAVGKDTHVVVRDECAIVGALWADVTVKPPRLSVYVCTSFFHQL